MVQYLAHAMSAAPSQRSARTRLPQRSRFSMTAKYLTKLNAELRRAVEHGADALDETPPLLIIAGAGSGKTNTLANRVAHLIVSAADLRRMMLLTFSRRAAVKMQRRVEHITAQVFGATSWSMAGSLSWSGTFYAVGARLLREHALDIGLTSNSRFMIAETPPIS
jgi:DNA helicase-2/ATP-dependent DNA helicase PcrA